MESESEGDPQAQGTAPADSGEFVLTKQHRLFAEFCDAVRRYHYIGLCYGPPGVGKTLSARRYARWEDIERILPVDLAPDESPLPPDVRAARTVLYTPTVVNTPGQIAREVHGLRHALSLLVQETVPVRMKASAWLELADCTELIIVDEADRLKMAGLEQMRDIYDRGTIGLVLIGMPGIEKRLARYPQLYSRVGFVHPFRPLSSDEVRFILEQKWEQLGLTLQHDDFTDAEAIAAIIRITGGNFRLLHRLLTQIERILQINELQVVTEDVVDAARESLVIGIV